MDQGLNLSQNIDTLFSNIERFTKTEGVIGKPVTHEDKTFIPVISVSVGCGGGNTASKMPQGGNAPAQGMASGANMAGGALGLGAKITTDAIIVIDKGNISMMTMSATGNATQLLDKIPEMVKGMTQQQQNKQS
ncbi:MAG TPA: spore germination protein GerW family protein [Clostridium sp.]|uniref:GerW family sporulation protein n=1 Tax=Clostridium sp. TaxID=1506 RepID=UPI002F946A62